MALQGDRKVSTIKGAIFNEILMALQGDRKVNTIRGGDI